MLARGRRARDGAPPRSRPGGARSSSRSAPCTSACSTARCSRRSRRSRRRARARRATRPRRGSPRSASSTRAARSRHIARPDAGACRGGPRSSATCCPCMLQWFADGADPDLGLLAFRRLSDGLGESYWFLRMLRDSSGAAHRLTTVLSGRAFVAGLLERIPEAAAWLENPTTSCARARSRPCSTRPRRPSPGTATTSTRPPRCCAPPGGARSCGSPWPAILGRHRRRRARARRSATSPTATADRRARPRPPRRARRLEFAVIAMGRYGGRELGFGSDADVLYVYRPAGPPTGDRPARGAERSCASSCRLTEDPRLPARPRHRPAPRGQERRRSCARSTPTGAYYARWSLTWEAQALLRARGAVGDDAAARATSSAWPTKSATRRRSPSGGARGQAHQGPGRVRAPAAGRRPRPAPQARPRVAQRRRVVRAAAAAAARAARARRSARPRRSTRSTAPSPRASSRPRTASRARAPPG